MRRIVRSIDLHSKKLMQRHHLTIPQVVLLREIQLHGRLSLGELAKLANLSNATVTGVVDRLEVRNLVHRVLSETDRRQIFVEIAAAGIEVLQTTPPPLQAGAVPTVDQFMQLILYRELLELKFQHSLRLMVVIYSTAGGLLAVIHTDVHQFVILITISR